MSRLVHIVSLIILTFVSIIGVAQQINPDPDKVYGPDQSLYNGKLYTFLPPAHTDGNQFISDQYFVNGSITLRGITYTGLELNYDLYNQQLVLKFKNSAGTMNLIAVSDAWLEQFRMDGMQFETIASGDTLKHIYQVLGKGVDRILYYRWKEMALENRYMSWNRVFSVPGRKMFVQDGNRLKEYKSNRSFTKCFEKNLQSAIKKHLRQFHIKVRKSADAEMSEVINYCNSIIR